MISGGLSLVIIKLFVSLWLCRECGNDKCPRYIYKKVGCRMLLSDVKGRWWCNVKLAGVCLFFNCLSRFQISLFLLYSVGLLCTSFHSHQEWSVDCRIGESWQFGPLGPHLVGSVSRCCRWDRSANNVSVLPPVLRRHSSDCLQAKQHASVVWDPTSCSEVGSGGCWSGDLAWSHYT